MSAARRKGATVIGFIAGILVANAVSAAVVGDWPWAFLNAVLFLFVFPPLYDSLRQP